MKEKDVDKLELVEIIIEKLPFVPLFLKPAIETIFKEVFDNWDDILLPKYLLSFIQMLYNLPSLIIYTKHNFNTINLYNDFLQNIRSILNNLLDLYYNEYPTKNLELIVYNVENFLCNVKFYEELFHSILYIKYRL